MQTIIVVLFTEVVARSSITTNYKTKSSTASVFEDLEKHKAAHLRET